MKGKTVVTGVGILSSISNNTKDFLNSLLTGKCGISYLDYIKDAILSIDIGAEIKDINFPELINRNTDIDDDVRKTALRIAQKAPFPLKTTLISALEAWCNSGIDSCDYNPYDIGLIVAGQNISQNHQYEIHQKYWKKPTFIFPTYAMNFMDTDIVANVSDLLGIRGEGFSVGGASASGNVAIIKAMQLIQLEQVKACLVIGPLTYLSPLELQAFYNIGAIVGKNIFDNPAEACRPFDERHSGFVYGQASACMMLESYEFASRRNAKILSEIAGCGFVLDSNRFSNPNVEGEAFAMEKALSTAGINRKDIDYINSHGSSSPLGDKTEIEAIKNVFKDSIGKVLINSTKALTGHCLFSAGIVEAISTILQLNQSFIHPNINLDNPIDKECNFAGKKSNNENIYWAMSNSFGFGGINSSIIFKKGDKNESWN